MFQACSASQAVDVAKVQLVTHPHEVLSPGGQQTWVHAIQGCKLCAHAAYACVMLGNASCLLSCQCMQSYIVLVATVIVLQCRMMP